MDHRISDIDGRYELVQSQEYSFGFMLKPVVEKQPDPGDIRREAFLSIVETFEE